MTAHAEELTSATPDSTPPCAPARKGPQIRWYRTPIDGALLRELSTRSDVRGALQTFGYLGIYATTACCSVYSATHWRWYVTAALVFLHGMVAGFMLNGVHELGHGTVFRT